MTKALKKAEEKADNLHKQMVAVQKTLAATQSELSQQVMLKAKLAQAVMHLPKPQAFAVIAGFAALTESNPNHAAIPAIVNDTTKWEGESALHSASCEDCGWMVVGNSEDNDKLWDASNAHAKAQHKGKHGMCSKLGKSWVGFGGLLPKPTWVSL